MIGVQAVTGGLLGVALLGSVALAGTAALAGGVVLALSGRKMIGVVCGLSGGIALAFIVGTVMQLFPPPIKRHVVDLRPQFHSTLRAPPAQCSQITSDEWCFVREKIQDLVVIFPNGSSRSFGASSLYAVFSGQNLKQVSFLLSPHPDRTALASLLEVETNNAVNGSRQKDAEEIVRRVRDNEVIQRDQHAVFSHLGYDVHVWVLPRHSEDESYGVWYEVLLMRAGD